MAHLYILDKYYDQFTPRVQWLADLHDTITAGMDLPNRIECLRLVELPRGRETGFYPLLEKTADAAAIAVCQAEQALSWAIANDPSTPEGTDIPNYYAEVRTWQVGGWDPVTGTRLLENGPDSHYPPQAVSQLFRGAADSIRAFAGFMRCLPPSECPASVMTETLSRCEGILTSLSALSARCEQGKKYLF